MRKLFLLLLIGGFLNCTHYGKLKLLSYLPNNLREVSGVQVIPDSNGLWMINDSGNEPELYEVSLKGEIQNILAVQAKNHDWEAVTSDEEGNLYIADFGNNNNKRKNLVILKIKKQELLEEDAIEVEKIKFSYPNQTKYPPKKKERFFDAESLLYKDGFLYVFTKSRVHNNYGKTVLYRIPSSKGNYTAEYISEMEHCSDVNCSITDATISPDRKKIALLTHQSVLVFTNFQEDDFLSGDMENYSFDHISQKEGITFKDNSTLYITDEASKMMSARLYEFSLKK
ncbi:hypothetical protein [Tenacibaculum sp.]|uniref:hypothetical protein n=1 Tax=Tenacibaculum sp. TaxID=1906242 RepID=UPI003D124D95